MGLVVRALEKVDVVGRDQPEPHVARPADELRVGLALGIHPMIVDLNEEILLPENVAVLSGQIAPALRIALENGAVDFSFEAAAQADEPLGMPGQQLLVDTRLVVEALEVRRTDQFDQIGPPLVRLGQHGQVEGRILARRGLLLVHRTRRDIKLASEDRLDPRLLRLLVKLDRTVKHPVIGHPHRPHAGLRDFAHQVRRTHRAVEHGVLGVQMKMHELRGGHIARLVGPPRLASGGRNLFSGWPKTIPPVTSAACQTPPKKSSLFHATCSKPSGPSRA